MGRHGLSTEFNASQHLLLLLESVNLSLQYLCTNQTHDVHDLGMACDASQHLLLLLQAVDLSLQLAGVLLGSTPLSPGLLQLPHQPRLHCHPHLKM